jgi:hypothetical protein
VAISRRVAGFVDVGLALHNVGTRADRVLAEAERIAAMIAAGQARRAYRLDSP